MKKFNETDFNEKINKLTTQFYSENKKKILFKSSQKFECAESITNSIGIEELIQRTIFIIPNTNSVFLDYTLFKTYATPDNYYKIITHILSLFKICIQNYGTYDCHVNLDSFTITAAQRYKDIIELFLQNCMTSNSECEYSVQLTTMYIYNTPNTFQNISKILLPLIDPIVKNKIVFYDKATSQKTLPELFYGLKN
jgi:hypothetical protein